MVSHSVYNLSDKRYVSTNDKADIIAARLHELKIAIAIMRKHPDALSEFICAVKGGSNHPAEGPTATSSKKHDYDKAPAL